MTSKLSRALRGSATSYSNFWSFFCPRICVGTWNVRGKLPPDNLDIDDWLHIDEPADIYVIG